MRHSLESAPGCEQASDRGLWRSHNLGTVRVVAVGWQSFTSATGSGLALLLLCENSARGHMHACTTLQERKQVTWEYIVPPPYDNILPRLFRIRGRDRGIILTRGRLAQQPPTRIQDSALWWHSSPGRGISCMLKVVRVLFRLSFFSLFPLENYRAVLASLTVTYTFCHILCQSVGATLFRAGCPTGVYEFLKNTFPGYSYKISVI